MKSIPTRLAVALGYIVAGLFTAEVLKLLLLHAQWLGSKKDAIDAVTTIISSALLLIGALFAYFRFFHGRTFARRIDIQIEPKIIRTSSEMLLHAVALEIKNIGNVPIWNPSLVLRIQQHCDNPAEAEEVTQWWEPFPMEKGTVIDTQESQQFYIWRLFPPTTWAVTYWTKVSSKRGETWTKAMTVSNRSEGEEPKSEETSSRAAMLGL